ncbi:hypothetical protein TNCV_954721 [Trichonephila clavipes]|nr:hypothetical protein TNCV_954721 [Trichonephila clavipes]
MIPAKKKISLLLSFRDWNPFQRNDRFLFSKKHPCLNRNLNPNSLDNKMSVITIILGGAASELSGSHKQESSDVPIKAIEAR